MSLMRRIWNAVRNPVRYVGRDLEGNKYYEHRSPTNPERTKRTVQYYDPEDMWRYIGGGKHMPIQWSSWLTHTRQLPPTVEELEIDLARQRRLLEDVSRIEARDRAEVEEMKRIRLQGAHLAVEEAVFSRAERCIPDSQPPIETEPHSSSEVPIRPSHETTIKLLPPKFVTPAMPRRARSSKLFSIPLTDPSVMVSGPTQVVNSGKDGHSPFTSRKTATDTESWTPKTRKRG